MKFFSKAIGLLYFVMIIFILVLVFLYGNTPYINQRSFVNNNVFTIFAFITLLLLFLQKKIDIKKSTYYKGLIIGFFILFTIQLIIVTYGYFTPTWDAGHLNRTVNYFHSYGVIDDMEYMTRYPNNSMLTFLLILIRSIPYLGRSNFILLLINCVLVNLSGLFTSLSIKNVTSNNRLALLSYFIIAPLVVLSPWIMVIYSDTFAILFPILIFYIFSKKHRDYRDYFFICFLAVFGYFIKPTVIIILLAIIFSKLVVNIKNILSIKRWKLKNILKISMISLLGVIVSLSLNNAGKVYMQYEKVDNVVQFSMLHFIAMGLNEKTQGIYNGQDVEDTINLGNEQNIDKIKERMSGRSFKEHLDFYAKKSLINFNDGSFAWGQEGSFFLNVKESLNPITLFIQKTFSYHGNDTKYFIVVQILWLTVLFLLPFILLKNASSENILVLMLAIIGISLFLTIFEARARYLYCYSPIFIVAAAKGLFNIKDFFDLTFYKMKRRCD